MILVSVNVQSLVRESWVSAFLFSGSSRVPAESHRNALTQDVMAPVAFRRL